MMKNFDQLFDGWMAGTLSKEETAIFLDQLEQNLAYPNLIDTVLNNPQHSGLGNDQLKKKMFSRIMDARDKQQTPVRKLFPRVAKWAAAILIITGAAATWWLISRQDAAIPLVAVQDESTLLPGGDKAVLVLSNGKKMILDSAANGQLAQEEGALIYKAEGDRLDYKQELSPAGTNENIANNTLYTPKGGQYKLTLPDGTKVWLNAASSITYPTAFPGRKEK